MKLVEKSQVLKKRYSYLSRKLFNRHYIEGFVYELIRFAELYELPRCLLDLIDLQQISAEKFVNTLKFGTNYLPTKTPFFEQLLREIPLH